MVIWDSRDADHEVAAWWNSDVLDPIGSPILIARERSTFARARIEPRVYRALVTLKVKHCNSSSLLAQHQFATGLSRNGSWCDKRVILKGYGPARVR